MKKNPKRKTAGKLKTLLVDVESLSWGGRGVGRSSGKVVFVSKSVPGDKVLAKILKEKPGHAEGTIKALLKPSPHRVPPRCKFSDHCGGCQWLNVSYDKQLSEKESMVRSFLRKHLDNCEVHEIIPAIPETGYRHRGEFHVHTSGTSTRLGFFSEASHKVVNVDYCRLFDRAFNNFYGQMRKSLLKTAARRYIRKVVAVQSEGEDCFTVHFKMKSSPSGAANELVKLSLDAGATGSIATPARAPGNILASEGELSISFTVPSSGTEKLLDLHADVRSFTQAHFPANRTLVKKVLSMAEVEEEDNILDLYSGIGNFSLPLATAAGKVIAVEQSTFSHSDAIENASRNNISNIEHINGDSLAVVGELADKEEHFNTIIMDPPREGALELPSVLSSLHPEKVIYISCSLPTLQRDLDEFKSAGYLLREVVPVDMFPQTYSVETVCLLTAC